MILTRQMDVLGDTPVSLPLRAPQISHRLTWNRTRASAVRGRRLTAWAMPNSNVRLIQLRTEPTSRVITVHTATCFDRLCCIRPWRWLKKGETRRRLITRCISLSLNISAGVGVCMLEVCTRCWWGNLRERGHWGDQDVDGRIILRWIFGKLEGVVGTGWNWLRIRTGGGHLWVQWGTFRFHKCGEFLD